eukprot:7339688-Prymnesium_polylepis.1
MPCTPCQRSAPRARSREGDHTGCQRVRLPSCRNANGLHWHRSKGLTSEESGRNSSSRLSLGLNVSQQSVVGPCGSPGDKHATSHGRWRELCGGILPACTVTT